MCSVSAAAARPNVFASGGADSRVRLWWGSAARRVIARHIIECLATSRNEVSKYVLLTWRAIFSGPWCATSKDAVSRRGGGLKMKCVLMTWWSAFACPWARGRLGAEDDFQR